MALILKDIYENTKQLFQLDLIAGSNGLNRIMNWVYVAEDYTTSDFLRGGELIITTGVLCNNSSWLLHFLNHMIRQNTCGVILNIGQYIHPENITDEVLDFCNTHQFPLFLMPWHIHIYDITREYYNRIFIDTQKDMEISNAFLSLLHHTSDSNTAISILSEYHFQKNTPYYVTVFAVSNSQNLCSEPSYNLTGNKTLAHLIYGMLMYLSYPCHFIMRDHYFLLILQQECFPTVEHTIIQLQERIHYYHSELSFSIGIGGVVNDLCQLSTSYHQALAALKMGKHKCLKRYSYEDMGFFKLLLAIPDTAILNAYINSHLNTIREYDHKHNSNFSQTLYLYLLHSGSIQTVAELSFCHRNTINHRIHIIKETLGYRLEDPIIRFELIAAFLIEEYMKAEQL